MIEGIISVLGLCITFLPILIYIKYLFTHIKTKTSFDYHLELVNDKKGRIGVFIAYIERLLFGICVSSLGFLMSEFFYNENAFVIFVVTLVVYIIVKYFDEKNEK